MRLRASLAAVVVLVLVVVVAPEATAGGGTPMGSRSGGMGRGRTTASTTAWVASMGSRSRTV
jgi:hypothetical protein